MTKIKKNTIKHVYLSKEKLEELKEDILSGNYTTKNLSKKYGISVATVCRRIKEVKENNLISEPKKEDNLITPYFRSRIIKVGLIKDRHNMPVNDFIFNEIISDDMFDYNRLDSTISNFILNRVGVTSINNKNYANHDLHVYVTGLQCALASLIKMCSIYNVGLTLLHWNRDTETYESQVIFKDNFKSSKDYFENVTGDIYFTKGCSSIEDLKDCKTFFLLKEIQNKRNDKNNSFYSTISNCTYIYKDEYLAWEDYLNICKLASINKNEVAIYLDCGKIENDGYTKIRTLSRTYNFEAEKKPVNYKYQKPSQPYLQLATATY